jgi:beta-lactamase regulating signal transducer with metallopeptidase domain
MTIESLLADATLKVSLIALAAIGATRVLRRHSAALRHWVLAAALLCAALMPLLRVIAPAWDLRRDPEPTGVLARLTEEPAMPARSQTPRPTATVAPARLLESIWLVGCLGSVGILAVGAARLARLAARSKALENERWTRIADDVARQYGIRRRVTWLVSDDPSLLFTWGAIAPKIVLPVDARDWTDDRIRIVVSHELAHVRRGDWLVQTLAALVRSAHWFNPLVWLACAELRRESEHACDDAVLNLGINRAVYATELVRLARTFIAYRRSTAMAWSPAPAMARTSSLERRVRAMLNAHGSRAPLTRAAAAATLVALFALALPLAGLGAQSGPAGFSGKLFDAIGRIMPDVPVTLTHTETGVKFEARSDANGLFAFATVPPGEYELYATAAGFSASRYRVTLKPGEQMTQSLFLQVGMLEETLTIVKPATPEPLPAPKRMTGDFPPLQPREPGGCDQSSIGGCIEPPKKLDNTRPQYPPDRSETVTVELRARIGIDGRIKWVEGRNVAAGTQPFIQAASDAVTQWRFTPTYLDGVPVEVEMKVTAHFVVE